MMKAPGWYSNWRQEAVDLLSAKQGMLEAGFRITTWPGCAYNLNAGTLTFSESDIPKVIAEVQVVGTTSPQDWLWSWGNTHWPESSFQDVLRVREFGREHGIEELTSKYLKAEDLNTLGWEMTAVTARILDAPGAYRPVTRDTGALFLVFRSIRFVN